jgi:hypothetical protein
MFVQEWMYCMTEKLPFCVPELRWRAYEGASLPKGEELKDERYRTLLDTTAVVELQRSPSRGVERQDAAVREGRPRGGD